MRSGLVVIGLVACSASARADVPRGVTQRLVRFVLDGCDYFGANEPQPFKETPDKQLAAHFGHIVRAERDGNRMRYQLKVPALERWDVSYFARGVDIKLPQNVTITLGELQRLLGHDEPPDVDNTIAPTDGTKSDTEERVFSPPGHKGCNVFVEIDADESKGAARRVVSLRFAD